jgi:hypothetical protein
MQNGTRCPCAAVRLKSVSNEGHFTLVAATVFLPYPIWYCRGVTEIYQVTFLVHGYCAVQARLKSVKYVGHFTFEARTLSRPTSRRIAVV